MRKDYQLTRVVDIFKDAEAFAGKTVTVGGWVKSNRDSKSIGFIVLSDGTCFSTLQIVYSGDLEEFGRIAKLNDGTAIIATGEIVLTPNAKQPLEMQAKKIEVEGESTPDYPMQRKRHSFEYLRTMPHLRMRTNTFQAVFRVRSVIAYAIHTFFQERGFVYIHTPIITGGSSENGRRRG